MMGDATVRQDVSELESRVSPRLHAALDRSCLRHHVHAGRMMGVQIDLDPVKPGISLVLGRNSKTNLVYWGISTLFVARSQRRSFPDTNALCPSPGSRLAISCLQPRADQTPSASSLSIWAFRRMAETL